MSNSDKIKLSAELVMSVLSNSSASVEDRLELIPKHLETIYNKICKLDNSSESQITFTDSQDETRVVV